MTTTPQRFSKIFFLHLPKTAGSSFRESMRAAMGRPRVGWVNPNTSLDELAEREARGESDFALVGGHVTMRQALPLYDGKCVFFATLRDPVSRVVSLYGYIRRRDAHPLHADLNAMSFRDAVMTHQGFRQTSSNEQCHYLSTGPQSTAREAVRTILTHPMLATTMDTRDLLLNEARRMFGAEAAGLTDMVFDYTTRPENEPVEPLMSDTAAIEEIRRLNQQDQTLHDWIAAAWQGHKDTDLDAFRDRLRKISGVCATQD